MAGKFNLIIQRPKAGKPINGVLSLDRHGDANFFSGDGGADSRLIASLTRARVDWAAKNGIMLSGFEQTKAAARYQEWWMIYA